MTPTHFAWPIVGGHEMPPKKAAASSTCWLCGGHTDGEGWPLRAAIKPTFTNHNQARCNTSDAVCQPCVAMQDKGTWEAYVKAHPDMGLKTGHAMSWRCYSHLFHLGAHECPDRKRHRDVLLDPPEPPFLLVIATSGQKHLIFRSQIAYSREHFPVQLEEETVFIQREMFRRLLLDFESGLNAGIGRDDLLTGKYHPATPKRIGVRDWRALETKLSPWRRIKPEWMRIAHHVAQREK